MQNIRLAIGSYYYYVDESYTIKLKMDKDEEIDKYNYDIGNYYHRIKEAYEYANRNSINNN